jgi:hypothetical protein
MELTHHNWPELRLVTITTFCLAGWKIGSVVQNTVSSETWTHPRFWMQIMVANSIYNAENSATDRKVDTCSG